MGADVSTTRDLSHSRALGFRACEARELPRKLFAEIRGTKVLANAAYDHISGFQAGLSNRALMEEFAQLSGVADSVIPAIPTTGGVVLH
jgi:hypothetical protein